jgi:hypothetical protein
LAGDLGRDLATLRHWLATLAGDFGQRLWPATLARDFGQRLWPATLVCDFGLRLWPATLAGDFSPLLWPFFWLLWPKSPAQVAGPSRRPKSQAQLSDSLINRSCFLVLSSDFCIVRLCWAVLRKKSLYRYFIKIKNRLKIAAAGQIYKFDKSAAEFCQILYKKGRKGAELLRTLFFFSFSL